MAVNYRSRELPTVPHTPKVVEGGAKSEPTPVTKAVKSPKTHIKTSVVAVAPPLTHDNIKLVRKLQDDAEALKKEISISHPDVGILLTRIIGDLSFIAKTHDMAREYLLTAGEEV